MPACDFDEHTFNCAQVFVFDTGTEVRNGCHVRETAGRPLVSDAQRLFEMEAAAHELTVHGLDGPRCQRPFVEPENAVQHRRLAVRGIDGRSTATLVLPNLDHKIRALVQQFDEALVDFVDLLPQSIQFCRICCRLVRFLAVHCLMFFLLAGSDHRAL